MPKDDPSLYDRKAVGQAFLEGLEQDMDNLAEMKRRIKAATKTAKNKSKPPSPPSGRFKNF